MNFGFESSDLERLLTDLNDASVKIGPAVRAVVSKGALNVRRDAKNAFEDQRVGNYLPLYGSSITYDLDTVGHVTTAVIGPESGKPQGSFGGVVEYGSPTSPAMPHLNPALDAEEPRFVDQVGDAAVRALS
jgi:hypothetical protein